MGSDVLASCLPKINYIGYIHSELRQVFAPLCSLSRMTEIIIHIYRIMAIRLPGGSLVMMSYHAHHSFRDTTFEDATVTSLLDAIVLGSQPSPYNTAGL